MTASLPAEVQEVFARFKTIELTTVDAQGQPVSWSAHASYRPGAPCIDVDMELAHRREADDARTNPLVGLLFSDPTDSGLSEPPMVLVQGTAHVDEGCIHVRPERVFVWPTADIAAEPELYDSHMEEVRSGHSEEPARFHAAPAGGASSWTAEVAGLGPTAVLSIISPDGFPFAIRVPISIEEEARAIGIGGAPTGIPFQPGLACLSAGDFQVCGDLVRDGDRWELVPHEFRPPAGP